MTEKENRRSTKTKAIQKKNMNKFEQELSTYSPAVNKTNSLKQMAKQQVFATLKMSTICQEKLPQTQKKLNKPKKNND